MNNTVLALLMILSVLTARPLAAGAQTVVAPADPPAVMAVPQPSVPQSTINVQIELTISDQVGNGPIEKKSVLMIAADGTWGRTRASGMVRQPRGNDVPVGLNVDARPRVSGGGAVLVELTLAYKPLGPQEDSSSLVRPTDLDQSLTVMLQDGKALVVSQAADPISDRRMIVEVKATILK